MTRRRKRGRRFEKLIPAVAVLLLLVFVFFKITVVRSVSIDGIGDPEMCASVIRASGVEYGKSIFSINRERIRRGIAELGYFESAEIDICFPSTVRIRTAVRTPCAMIPYAGRLLILDRNANVLEITSYRSGDELIYLSDLKASGYRIGEPLHADTKAYSAVMGALEDAQVNRLISEMRTGDAENITLITKDGYTVLFGNSENAAAKIAWMLAAVNDLSSRGEYGGVLDVSSGSKADYRPPSA